MQCPPPNVLKVRHRRRCRCPQPPSGRTPRVEGGICGAVAEEVLDESAIDGGGSGGGGGGGEGGGRAGGGGAGGGKGIGGGGDRVSGGSLTKKYRYHPLRCAHRVFGRLPAWASCDRPSRGGLDFLPEHRRAPAAKCAGDGGGAVDSARCTGGGGFECIGFVGMGERVGVNGDVGGQGGGEGGVVVRFGFGVGFDIGGSATATASEEQQFPKPNKNGARSDERGVGDEKKKERCWRLAHAINFPAKILSASTPTSPAAPTLTHNLTGADLRLGSGSGGGGSIAVSHCPPVDADIADTVNSDTQDTEMGDSRASSTVEVRIPVAVTLPLTRPKAPKRSKGNGRELAVCTPPPRPGSGPSPWRSPRLVRCVRQPRPGDDRGEKK